MRHAQTMNRIRGKRRLLSRGVAVAVATVAVVAAAACSSSSSSSAGSSAASGSSASDASSGLTTVKLAVLPPSTGDAFMPIYASEDLGIAQKLGIKFQFVQVESGSAMLTAVLAGSADFAMLPVPTAAEAIYGGSKIQMFAPSGPGGAGFYLLVKAGSGITNIQQLKGKSIGISAAGSETADFAAYTSAKYDLNAKLVPVGFTGIQPALLSGKIDAGIIEAPQSYQLLASKQAVALANYGTLTPLTFAWTARTGYADANKAIASKVLEAWYGAIAEMQKDPSLGYKELQKINDEPASEAKQEFQYGFAKAPTSGALTASWINDAYTLVKAAGVTRLPAASSLVSNDFASVTGSTSG